MSQHKKKSRFKKERQKQKKANRKPNKALLDTSFQMERIKWEEEFVEHVNKLSSDHDIYSSHFVLYEFKISLIHSLIRFYNYIILYEDSSKAKIRLSEERGREVKNQLIINAIIERTFNSINTKDIPNYLIQVEFVILKCQEMFYERLNGIIGNFADDEIVKYKIESKDDYEGFMELYKKRKSIIPLHSFWDANSESLGFLLASPELKKEYKKLFIALEKIALNTNKASTFVINKTVGDAVIAVDSPKDYTIITIDKSFSYLCPPLGKKSSIYAKPVIPATTLTASK